MQYINKVKNKLPLYIFIFVLLLILAICFFVGNKIGNDAIIEKVNLIESKEAGDEEYPYQYISNNDKKDTYENAVEINLNTVNNHLEINDGGEYLLFGKLNGTIIISAKDETVHLFLNNADIESIGGPAIIVDKANKVVITLLENTVNTISDNGDYKEYGNYESCISSDSNLVFNGKGSLNVYGLYKDAIRTNDVIKILDGNISIESKKTAIHGTDGIHINGGNISIASEKNGLKTTKNGSDNRGTMIISGGSLDIIAGRYAFVCEAPLYIYDCSIHQKSVATYCVNNDKYIEQGCIND